MATVPVKARKEPAHEISVIGQRFDSTKILCAKKLCTRPPTRPSNSADVSGSGEFIILALRPCWEKNRQTESPVAVPDDCNIAVISDCHPIQVGAHKRCLDRLDNPAMVLILVHEKQHWVKPYKRHQNTDTKGVPRRSGAVKKVR